MAELTSPISGKSYKWPQKVKIREGSGYKDDYTHKITLSGKEVAELQEKKPTLVSAELIKQFLLNSAGIEYQVVVKEKKVAKKSVATETATAVLPQSATASADETPSVKINQAVVEWIKAQHTAGVSFEEIRETLSKAGKSNTKEVIDAHILSAYPLPAGL